MKWLELWLPVIAIVVFGAVVLSIIFYLPFRECTGWMPDYEIYRYNSEGIQVKEQHWRCVEWK